MKLVRNIRGITPIISVILLLMMTIAIAGLAYSWLQKMQSSIQTSSENTTTRLLGSLKVGLRIDGYTLNCSEGTTSDVGIHIRNTGTEAAKNLQLYVNDGLQVGKNTSSLEAGGTYTFVYQDTESCSSWSGASKTIKVVSDEGTASTTFTMVCSTGSC